MLGLHYASRVLCCLMDYSTDSTPRYGLDSWSLVQSPMLVESFAALQTALWT